MIFEHLIGQAPNFEAILRNARIVAATDATVLIAGETGTGKELLARAIQRHSPRAGRTFITVNGAALPEALAESELFGHRKGSFTGAVGTHVGRLAAADGGTIFLDEVDSLPIPLQSKLLRFLETGEIQPVGETRASTVDVRVIAAANANLGEAVAAGRFRKDLYYRLNVVPIEVPSLRERRGDIPLLLSHFIRQFAAAHHLPEAAFSMAALNWLTAYAWPGNVRELRNLSQRLVILHPGRTIEESHLPPEIVSRAPAPAALFELPASGIDLEQVKIALIRQALQRTGGNRSRAARLLGISRDTLLYRMQKYRLG